MRSAEHAPDLAIVDIRLPPTFTRRGPARRARAAQPAPETAILVLSQYVEHDLRRGAARRPGAGGVGYLLKDRVLRRRRLRRRGPARRRRRHGPRPRGRRPARSAEPGAPIGSTSLTPRERDVLKLMAEGRSNAAIAERWCSRSARSRSTSRASSRSSACRPRTTDHRRVLAVLAYLGTVPGGDSP